MKYKINQSSVRSAKTTGKQRSSRGSGMLRSQSWGMEGWPISLLTTNTACLCRWKLGGKNNFRLFFVNLIAWACPLIYRFLHYNRSASVFCEKKTTYLAMLTELGGDCFPLHLVRYHLSTENEKYINLPLHYQEKHQKSSLGVAEQSAPQLLPGTKSMQHAAGTRSTSPVLVLPVRSQMSSESATNKRNHNKTVSLILHNWVSRSTIPSV